MVALNNAFTYRNHFVTFFEFLAMNLREIIEINGFVRFPRKFMQTFLQQSSAMLCQLQACQLIHGAICPKNIMFTPDFKHLKLVDLTCALHECETPPRLAHSSYSAPEQLLGLQWGHPAELWSLGCVLVEMFMGAPPFTGSPTEMLREMCRFLGPPPAYLLQHS